MLLLLFVTILIFYKIYDIIIIENKERGIIMFTKGMIAIATNIVKNLDLPREFGCDEETGDFEDYTLVSDQLPCDIDINIDNGISKLVLIPKDMPFVIKIPFNGMHYHEYEYDEENDEYTECRDEFYPFTVHPDYCDFEMELVQQAQDRGFEQFVLDTICFYVDKNGRNYYLQEKATPSRYSYGMPPREISEHSKEVAASMSKAYCRCDEKWRASVVECYGENMWITFVDWNAMNGLGILDDMHGGNYGYREDGTPVLIDISGFDDN